MNELTTKTETLPTTDYRQKAVEFLQSQGTTLPQKDLSTFVEMASAFGLNPFKREIYAVGYGDNKWNIITGFEVYLKRSERTGKLNGWNVEINGSGDNMTATITIYRKDWEHPFKHTVLFSEVCQKTRDGRLNSVWAKMPSYMTKKVCIAQGFRLCFPDEFGGMPYTSDEVPEAERPIEEVRNVTPQTPKTERKFTQEQALEIGRILSSELFTEEDKSKYRTMIQTEGGEKTLAAVKFDFEQREKGFQDAEAVFDSYNRNNK